MILPIVQYGDPVLRKRCKPVEEVSEELVSLSQDMIETMHDAHGVGLAAPQVGLDIRLAVVDVSHDPECVSFLRVNGEETAVEDLMPLIFINPEFELSGEKERMEEGCLSIQEIRAEVQRPTVLKGTFGRLDGSEIALETDGLLARVIQHETDHLNGVLFIDRVSAATKLSLRRKLKHLQNMA
jgi:peptide deformylase